MNEVYVIDREFLFKEKLYEITSISIEENHHVNDAFVEGEFIVSGDYRLHEISINKDDFCFKVPFSHEIKSNIDLDTITLEITDFNYEFKNEDELSIHIEYVISGEEKLIEFETQKELEEFLNNENIEVVDLKEDNNEDIDRNEEIVTEEEPKDSIDHQMILNSLNSEENYVKYHIHTVTMDDTIENICNKYSTNLNTLKKYNTFDTLELNMKLLIPENDES